MQKNDSISIFDIFKVGIGPSSSHTVGPMNAANMFIAALTKKNLLTKIARIEIEIFGSLAHTGKGHGTDKAILLGLEGENAETVVPEYFQNRFTEIITTNSLNLAGKKTVVFNAKKHFRFRLKKLLPLHSNAIRISVYTQTNRRLLQKVYYSIGGGFVVTGKEKNLNKRIKVPFPFSSAMELFSHCRHNKKSIAKIILANELIFRSEEEIKSNLDKIIHAMFNSIKTGIHHDGILPGGLNVVRRAPLLFKKLSSIRLPSSHQETNSLNYAAMYAFAVSEENADYGRIVTAPTNGSSGIIPAVLKYLKTFYPNISKNKLYDLLLTAGAIGMVYKHKASFSAAEVGCQGEVGVACSMAAAGLTAVLGGTLTQIENAAVMGIEHHLGLTCDPVLGLVQIPCIERNAVAAIKAITIANLCLLEENHQKVTLDRAALTMMQTGLDMSAKYKETSKAGLAINVFPC